MTRQDVPADRIVSIRISSCYLPLATPISDAKVLTGRQKPMTEIAMLFAEIRTRAGPRGAGLQLLQARRRPRPVRACEGGRAGAARRGSERHRQALDQALLGRRLGRPQRPVDAGDRCLRRGAVRPEGQARRPVARQAARLATATRSAATTPRAASCTRRSSSCSSTPRRRSSAASAASSSRSASPTARSTSSASRRCASTSATRCRSWSTRTSNGTGRPRSACAASSSSTTWSGSRSRSTPTTMKAMPRSPPSSTRRSPPARC